MGKKVAAFHFGACARETAIRSFGLFVLLLAVSVPPVAVATDAKESIRVHYNRGCTYYIVETAQGYALLDWYGGKEPSEGDVLVGDYESYGMKDINDRPASSRTRAWVEDFWMSRDRVNKKYVEKCR